MSIINFLYCQLKTANYFILLPLEIIHTELNDLDFSRWLLEEANAYQTKNGYSTWTNFDMELIRNEINSKSQYKIIIENEIACIFSIVYSDKPLWKEMENGDALYLHRIIVNPKHKGKRLFGNILDWSVQVVNNKGLNFIRMDTWADNPTLIHYYKTFGFQFIKNITTSNEPELAPQYRNKFLALMEYEVRKGERQQ